MATEQQIGAVVDIIIESFEGNAELFRAFLERSMLETEMRALESEQRRIVARRNSLETANMEEYGAAITTNAEARAAKQAEIDALNAE